jgi:hypothetical protein
MGAFAYPIVIFVISVIFMLIFRRPIATLIDRTKKIGPTGLDASGLASQQLAVETQQAQVEEKPSETKSKTYEEFQTYMAPFRFPSMTRRAEELKTNLDFGSLTQDQLREMAVDLGAFFLMAGEFENIYTLIFGSQISALHDLNTVYVVGRPLTVIKLFYDRAAAVSPSEYQNFPFDQWLGFLQRNNLIIVPENVIAKISEDGRDFLRYLIQIGKPLNKGL